MLKIKGKINFQKINQSQIISANKKLHPIIQRYHAFRKSKNKNTQKQYYGSYFIKDSPYCLTI